MTLKMKNTKEYIIKHLIRNGSTWLEKESDITSSDH